MKIIIACLAVVGLLLVALGLRSSRYVDSGRDERLGAAILCIGGIVLLVTDLVLLTTYVIYRVS